MIKQEIRAKATNQPEPSRHSPDPQSDQKKWRIVEQKGELFRVVTEKHIGKNVTLRDLEPLEEKLPKRPDPIERSQKTNISESWGGLGNL